ncbi:hypothetical protein LIER_36131 [Lithospermum erythrorhizon]|uniref:Uncharacterized protein n=1 Tax=Lithospermum erythrorhizon TaxID=34254 RepID=A0AAV3P2J9_LITER
MPLIGPPVLHTRKEWACAKRIAKTAPFRCRRIGVVVQSDFVLNFQAKVPILPPLAAEYRQLFSTHPQFYLGIQEQYIHGAFSVHQHSAYFKVSNH